jgi:hypothetical protein
MTRILLAALLLAPQAGTQEPPPPIVVAKGAEQPQLAADKDGGLYCVFLRKGNVEVAVSTDDGATWSAPAVAIDAHGMARGGMQRGPRIGVDEKKRVAVTAPVCFDPNELREVYPKAELWVAWSENGGRTFGAPVQVNEQKGTAPESLHAMAVAPTGEVHVAWLDLRGRTKGQDLYYCKVVDGKPGRNVKIATTLCECCAPGIAVDGAGNPILAWRDGAEKENRPVWFAASKDGGKAFRPPQRLHQIETKVEG